MKKELPEQLQFLASRKATQKTCGESMRGKLCVVTGSTSGVGLQAIERLAKAGSDIVMVCRDRGKAEPIGAEIAASCGVRVDIVTADFSDLAQVRGAADEILSRFPRIDVLINSAGIHSTTRKRTREGFELVFCVNHLASFLLTGLLTRRMRESSPSRIIQVNSEGHRFGGLDLDDLDWSKRHYTGLKGYGASKVAQLLTVWEISDRLRGSGVTINAMHPGDVRTNIGNNNGPLYRIFKKVFINPLLKDASISGEALYWLAASVEAGRSSGKFFHLTVEEKPTDQALDRVLGKLVWEKSLELTGLSEAVFAEP
jgi:NAD(P)-dependent dehydrogenase (short-subunit alcohol dehydrogenase family)